MNCALKSSRVCALLSPFKVLLFSGVFTALNVFSIGELSAQTGDLLFFQQTTGSVYTINQTTGVSTLLASSTQEGGLHYWNGAAYDSDTNLVYVSDVGTDQELGSLATGVTTNTIYSFNRSNPTTSVVEVGTISTEQSFYDAAVHNGLYYTIPIGTTTLESYDFTGHSGSGALTGTMVSLAGLTAPKSGGGTGPVTAFVLGDLSFIGNSLYIYGLATTGSGGTLVATNMFYKYTDVATAGTSGPSESIVEGTGAQTGAGLTYNTFTSTLLATDTNNNLYSIVPGTGAETLIAAISGPDTGGNGDYTIATVPEPAPFYAIGLIILLVTGSRLLRRWRASEPAMARA